MMRKFIPLALVTALAACGGGGDGGNVNVVVGGGNGGGVIINGSGGNGGDAGPGGPFNDGGKGGDVNVIVGGGNGVVDSGGTGAPTAPADPTTPTDPAPITSKLFILDNMGVMSGTYDLTGTADISQYDLKLTISAPRTTTTPGIRSNDATFMLKENGQVIMQDTTLQHVKGAGIFTVLDSESAASGRFTKYTEGTKASVARIGDTGLVNTFTMYADKTMKEVVAEGTTTWTLEARGTDDAWYCMHTMLKGETVAKSSVCDAISEYGEPKGVFKMRITVNGKQVDLK